MGHSKKIQIVVVLSIFPDNNVFFLEIILEEMFLIIVKFKHGNSCNLLELYVKAIDSPRYYWK